MLVGIRFVDDGERGIDGEPEGRGVRWRRPGAEGPNPEGPKMFKLIAEAATRSYGPTDPASRD
jgi:hypothetical protein